MLLAICYALVLPAQIYVTQNGAGNKDGTAWNNAYDNAQLQQAIFKAKTAKIKQVWVAKGIYKPTESLSKTGTLADGSTPVNQRDNTFILQAGVQLFGGFAGNEAPDFDLQKRDFIKNETILSGDLNNNNTADDGDSYHVVASQNSSAGAALDGFTIQHGFANGTGSIKIGALELFQYNGAAVALIGSNTSATFKNLVVKNNASTGTSDGNGGGAFHIFNSNSAKVYTISNVTFQDNQTAGAGGALFVRGLTLHLTKSTFKNNNAGGNGGAAFLYSGNHTVSEVVFEANKTIGQAGGGAVYGLNNASFAIQKSTFKNNASGGSGGGAIYYSYHGLNNSVSETVFEGNISSNNGGAIQSYSQGLTLNKTVFKSNTANNSGGALYLNSNNKAKNDSEIKILNTVFYNNISKTPTAGNSGGGAIYQTRAKDKKVALTVVNSTFYANKSVSPYGAYSFSSSTSDIKLYNNIFNGNLGKYNISADIGNSADIRNLSSVTQTLSNNLFQNNIAAESNRTVTNAYSLGADKPLFASIKDTDANFLFLKPESVAIDKGDNRLYPEDAGKVSDLAGLPRLAGSAIDLGAYEYQK